MKDFFKSLFSSEIGSISSKRVVAIWSLVLFTIEVIAHIISKINVQGEIILATVTLITVPLGLNVAQSIKAISSKSEVAQSIVKEDASIENTNAAQDVLTNNKPQE